MWKADIGQRKVMLSLWWEALGAMLHQLLPSNQSVATLTVGRWTVSANSSSRNFQTLLIVKESCFITTTSDHTNTFDLLSKLIGARVG